MLCHPYVEREQLVVFQNARLRRLVDHAYRHVSYCPELFDRHGLKTQDARTVRDLAFVPITTRSALQALPLKGVASGHVKPEPLITQCFLWLRSGSYQSRGGIHARKDLLHEDAIHRC